MEQEQEDLASGMEGSLESSSSNDRLQRYVNGAAAHEGDDPYPHRLIGRGMSLGSGEKSTAPNLPIGRKSMSVDYDEEYVNHSLGKGRWFHRESRRLAQGKKTQSLKRLKSYAKKLKLERKRKERSKDLKIQRTRFREKKKTRHGLGQDDENGEMFSMEQHWPLRPMSATEGTSLSSSSGSHDGSEDADGGDEEDDNAIEEEEEYGRGAKECAHVQVVESEDSDGEYRLGVNVPSSRVLDLKSRQEGVVYPMPPTDLNTSLPQPIQSSATPFLSEVENPSKSAKGKKKSNNMVNRKPKKRAKEKESEVSSSGKSVLRENEEECLKLIQSFADSEDQVELDLGRLELKAVVGFKAIVNSDQCRARLNVLRLGGNKLRNLPNGLENLESLSILHLFTNRLSEHSFPSSLSLSRLANLQTLSLSQNRFERLPMALTQLKSLTNLDLHSNQIRSFSSSLDGKENETRAVLLALSDSLTSLNLGYNQLEGEFDFGLCLKFSNKLERLYLQGNHLSALPESMKDMKKLKILRISGNPLQRPPVSTAERGPTAVRQFFHSAESNGYRVLNKKRARAWQRLRNQVGIFFGGHNEHLRNRPSTPESIEKDSHAILSRSCPTSDAMQILKRMEVPYLPSRTSSLSPPPLPSGFAPKNLESGQRKPPSNTEILSLAQKQTPVLRDDDDKEEQQEGENVVHPDAISEGEAAIVSRQHKDEITLAKSKEDMVATRDPEIELSQDILNRIVLVEQEADENLEEGSVLEFPEEGSLSANELMYLDASDGDQMSSTQESALTKNVNEHQHGTSQSLEPVSDGKDEAENDEDDDNDYASEIMSLRRARLGLGRGYSRQSSSSTNGDGFSRSFKIIVVGSSSAGKTSMVRTLLSGESMVMKPDERTIGIDIYPYERSHKVSPDADDEENVSFSIWDFAGQEVYHGTHQFFLSRRALYILVWDVYKNTPEELDTDVMFWIYSIQARIPGAVILIVASKCENLSDEQVNWRWKRLLRQFDRHEEWRKTDLERLALHHSGDEGENRWRLLGRMRPRLATRELTKISSLFNLGFKELRERIVRAALNEQFFPHMGPKASIPLRWGVVEDVIIELSKIQQRTYVTWKELIARVIEEGSQYEMTITEDDIAACLAWLDDIGDVVHNEMRTSSSIVFLDTVWLVNVVKRLVVHGSRNKHLVDTMNDTITSYCFKSISSNGRSPLPSGPMASQPRRIEQLLRRHMRKLQDEGILNETLLPILWPDLFSESEGYDCNKNGTYEKQGNNGSENEDNEKSSETSAESDARLLQSLSVVDHLLDVLGQFDICYELAPIQGQRQWLVPCLLRTKFDLRQHWPPQEPVTIDLQHSVHCTIELGRRYTFNNFAPPGLMARLLHHVCSNQPGGIFAQQVSPKVWANAALFGFPSKYQRKNQSFRLLVHLYSLQVPKHDHHVGTIDEADLDDGSDDDIYYSDGPSDQTTRTRWVLDVCARGDSNALLRMWHALVHCFEAVEEVLLSYQGLESEVSIICPRCLQLLGENRRAAYEFDVFDVQAVAGDQEMERVWDNIFYHDLERVDQVPENPVYGCYFDMPCYADSSAQSEPHNCPLVWLAEPPLDMLSDYEEAQRRRWIQIQESHRGREPYRLPLQGTQVWVDARAVLRIGVYNVNTSSFLQQGSGFVVSKDLGLIVTAAHLVINPVTAQRKYPFPLSIGDNNGRLMSPEDFVKSNYWIVIGTFVDERQPPIWKYVAAGVLHGASNGDSSPDFIDTFVLRIIGEVTEDSSESFGVSVRSHSVFQTVKLRIRNLGNYAKLLPLSAEIRLGNSNNLRVHDPVSLLGFPSLRGESICVDSGLVNQLSGYRYINCNTFQHQGSSGGPLLDRFGEVVGIMSKGFSPGDFGQHTTVNSSKPLIQQAKVLVENDLRSNSM